ncbi:MAG: hypothetical protein ABFS24_03270 [Pseudomonadota bacterium]
MSDDNTISINLKFNKNLKLKEIVHIFKDKNGNEKSKKIKAKKKFKVDFDKVDAMCDVTLIRGEIAGVDPYCIKVGGTLYCFP